MFKDRVDAGKLLTRQLLRLKKRATVIAAIPRGGVVIGYQISKSLNLPLVPLVVKKVPTLVEPELAVGAIGPEGVSIGKKSKKIEKIVAKRIEEYGKVYDFEGETVILVDDGVATGLTIETAIAYLRKKKAKKILVAVPVVAEAEFAKLSELSEEVIALEVPGEFRAIGEFYYDFSQVDDREVIQLLQKR